MIELIKPLEDWTDAEKIALLNRPEGLPESNPATIPGLRARVTASHQGTCFTPDDMAMCINAFEEGRVFGHILIGMAISQIRRYQKVLAGAKCAYCAWEFHDETPWDDDVVGEAEATQIAAYNLRVEGAIREHVKVCEKHPMRELERNLNDAMLLLRERPDLLEEFDRRCAERELPGVNPLASGEMSGDLTGKVATASPETPAIQGVTP
jgi:hypothetical protein